MAADKCRVCGSDDIDHGSEHMGIVEFPDSICEACFRVMYPPVAPPPASPEPMPEWWTAVCAVPGAPVAFRRNGTGYRFVTLEVIRQLLATQGLHIVDEASAKVLEAMAEIPEESMGWAQAISHSLDAALEAELARREKEKRNA